MKCLRASLRYFSDFRCLFGSVPERLRIGSVFIEQKLTGSVLTDRFGSQVALLVKLVQSYPDL